MTGAPVNVRVAISPGVIGIGDVIEMEPVPRAILTVTEESTTKNPRWVAVYAKGETPVTFSIGPAAVPLFVLRHSPVKKARQGGVIDPSGAVKRELTLGNGS